MLSALKILFKKLLKSQNTAALFYVQVNHFKINYKIVLKAVTPIYVNIFEGGIVLPCLDKQLYHSSS